MPKKDKVTKKQASLHKNVLDINQLLSDALSPASYDVENLDLDDVIVGLIIDCVPKFSLGFHKKKFSLGIRTSSFISSARFDSHLTASEVKMEIAKALLDFRARHLRPWLTQHQQVAERQVVTAARARMSEILNALAVATQAALINIGYDG